MTRRFRFLASVAVVGASALLGFCVTPAASQDVGTIQAIITQDFGGYQVASARPTDGQVLTFTTAGNKWTAGSATGATASALATTGASVNVSAAAPPTANQVLTATSATTATWQTPSSTASSLAATLVAGAVTGGRNITLSTGDSIRAQSDLILAATVATANVQVSSNGTSLWNYNTGDGSGFFALNRGSAQTTTFTADAAGNVYTGTGTRFGVGGLPASYLCQVIDASTNGLFPADVGIVLQDSQGSPRKVALFLGNNNDVAMGSITNHFLEVVQNFGSGGSIFMGTDGGMIYSIGAVPQNNTNYQTTSWLAITSVGNVLTGNAASSNSALATNATTHFVYLPSTNGQPGGTPTLNPANGVATTVDNLNDFFGFYSSNAWKRPPTIHASANISAQTTNATITSYATPASDADFEISGQINVTAATAISTSLTCTYTDVSNTSRTMIIPISGLAGSFLAGGLATGTGSFESAVMHIRAKASTTITILTAAGTFSSVTYSASAVIKRTA